MKPTRNLFLLATLIGISFQSYAQSGRGPMSTTAIGHMAVTLLSPAAVSTIQDLSFSNVSLRSSSTNGEMQMGTLRVQGNKATYDVTVSNRAIGFNQKGSTISIDHFSTYSDTDFNGASTINIGATMHVKKAVPSTDEQVSPLAVTINYN